MSRGRVTREVRMALQSTFGRATPGVVFVGVCLLVLLDTVTTALAELLDATLHPSLRIAFSLVVVFVAVVAAAWSRGPIAKYRVTPAEYPARIPGLIVFLSWPGGQPGPLPELGAVGIDQGAVLASDPSPVEHLVQGHPYGSWRMPLEGIRYHSPCLRHLVVITSADSDDTKKDGSYRCAERFKRVLALFTDLRSLRVDVLPSEGVPFEDLEALDGAVSHAVDHLRSLGLKRKEVVIDITSGKATCSVAGAIRSLDEDLSFQYVSTTDMHVRGFDMIPDPEG